MESELSMTSRIVLFIILLITLVIFVAPVVLTAAGVLSLPLRIVLLLIFLPILVAVALFRTLRIVREGHEGILTWLGRHVATRGPGLVFLYPFFDRLERIDIRIRTFEIDQECITHDDVPVTVKAVVQCRVVNSESALFKVQDYIRATKSVCQSILLNVVGEWDLAQLLTEQQSLSEKIPVITNNKTRSWGVGICRIMLKQTEIPESMRKAMIRESETERIRRAVVKEAEGNRQAARTIAEEPSGLYLRYLQSLKDITSGKSTIVFLPLPGELLKSLTDSFKQATQRG